MRVPREGARASIIRIKFKESWFKCLFKNLDLWKQFKVRMLLILQYNVHLLVRLSEIPH